MFTTNTHDTNEVCKEKKILADIICDMNFVSLCGNQVFILEMYDEDLRTFYRNTKLSESSDKTRRYIINQCFKSILKKCCGIKVKYS